VIAESIPSTLTTLQVRAQITITPLEKVESLAVLRVVGILLIQGVTLVVIEVVINNPDPTQIGPSFL
jgi:hypothetical protein